MQSLKSNGGEVCVCSRGHNDVAIDVVIEEVVSEVTAVLHRSCVEEMGTWGFVTGWPQRKSAIRFESCGCLIVPF